MEGVRTTKFHRPGALTPALVAALAILCSSLATGGVKTSAPAQGLIEWAEEVSKAWQEVSSAETPEDIERDYKRLFTLYKKCGSCRRALVRDLERRLERRPEEAASIHRVLEGAFEDDPLSLGRLFNETGRSMEAKRLAESALKHARYMEDRLDLIEMLADAHARLGEMDEARRLARRLIDETPVSLTYCEQSLRWWAWLGEEKVPDEDSSQPLDFKKKFERLGELERVRGNIPYVSCLFNHQLWTLDKYLAASRSMGLAVPDEVLTLFPDGIPRQQEMLARRTPDPKVRAAILLHAAWRYWTIDPQQTDALAREANRASPSRDIEVGTLVTEIMALFFPERRKELEAVALRLIDGFPEYKASCDGCVGYWAALESPWPEFSNRIPEWERKCRGKMNACPVDRWLSVVGFFPPANKKGMEVYEALLADGVPDEVLPMLLLRLRTAIGANDPKRSWELARRVIHHPEFPSMMLGGRMAGFSQTEAEDAGDFESALILELLSRTSVVNICDDCNWSRAIDADFRRNYYELRAGVHPHERWKTLIGLLPLAPCDPSSTHFHDPYYLDRLVEAAIVVHEEGAALAWFRNLEQAYHDASEITASAGEGPSQREHLLGVNSMLVKYIGRLHELSSDR